MHSHHQVFNFSRIFFGDNNDKYRYVVELYNEGEAIKFMLPITRHGTLLPDKEDAGLHGLHLTIDLEMNSDIVGIESQYHLIESKIDGKRIFF